MMNQIELVGYLSNDPHINKTRAGVKVANFPVVVPSDNKNKAGNYPEDLIRCTAFGKLADIVNNFAKKSTLVSVIGRLESGRYTDKETGKSYDSYTVHVSRFTALDYRRNSRNNNYNNSNSADHNDHSENSTNHSDSDQHNSDATNKGSVFKRIFNTK